MFSDCLFIGGPIDGRRAVVPQAYDTFTVPYQSRMPVKFDTSEPVDTVFKTYTYQQMFVMNGTAKIRLFVPLECSGVEWIASKLIKGYHEEGR